MTWPLSNQVTLDEDESWGYSCLSMIDKETVGIFYESSVAHMTFQAIDGAILTPKVMRSYNFVSTLARRFKRL